MNCFKLISFDSLSVQIIIVHKALVSVHKFKYILNFLHSLISTSIP